MKAFVKVYLTAPGCEHLSKLGLDSYWDLYLVCRVECVGEEGSGKSQPPYSQLTNPEANSVLVGTTTIELPSRDAATHHALAGLDAELANARAVEAERIGKIARRRSELLAITWDGDSENASAPAAASGSPLK